ncbi:hypothetical protein CYY_007384 [Polysphondylium violaceum]|uniref:Potassium channel tetramerisation-type BTB domain-containing protein n=1 Tax=Polysphondylium violaceum TaxID=133409 RepID=A0A8J4UXR1_9MYCE|nr:hypothetical protein CYY_007384 [Polysphondylium violaceum]
MFNLQLFKTSRNPTLGMKTTLLIILINGHFGSLQQDITELLKRKDVLLDVTKVIDVSVIPDPITLNIGGFKHQTTKATLTKIPNSFFDLMLSGEIDIKPMTNKPNTYFIER